MTENKKMLFLKLFNLRRLKGGNQMRKGFTLIELLIVIAILAILAGAIVPMFNVTRKQAKEARVAADLDSIKTASIMHHHDTGVWPPEGNTGVGLVNNDNNIADWNGPYLDEWKNDTYKNPYEIYSDGTQLSVRSRGPDGRSGTSDDISLLITPDKNK